MTDSLTNAVIQRNIIPRDPAANLLGALEMLRGCLSQRVELFVMTELWSTGMLDSDDGSAEDLAEGFFRNLRRFLSRFPGVIDLSHAARIVAICLLSSESAHSSFQETPRTFFNTIS